MDSLKHPLRLPKNEKTNVCDGTERERNICQIDAAQFDRITVSII